MIYFELKRFPVFMWSSNTAYKMSSLSIIKLIASYTVDLEMFAAKNVCRLVGKNLYS